MTKPRQPGEHWCDHCSTWRTFKGDNCTVCGSDTWVMAGLRAPHHN